MEDIKNSLGLKNVQEVYRNLDIDTLIEHAITNE